MVTSAGDLFMTVVVREAEDGNGYIAYIREFPGCFADGETAEEAEENLRDVTSTFLIAQHVKKH